MTYKRFVFPVFIDRFLLYLLGRDSSLFTVRHTPPPLHYILQAMPPKSSLKQFTADEVGRHRSRADLYIVVDDKVYDVTGFIEEHPYVAQLPTYSFSLV